MTEITISLDPDEILRDAYADLVEGPGLDVCQVGLNLFAEGLLMAAAWGAQQAAQQVERELPDVRVLADEPLAIE